MLQKLHQLFPAMRQEQAIVPGMDYIASKNKDLPKQAISQPLMSAPVESQVRQMDFPTEPAFIETNQSPWGRVDIKPGQFTKQPDYAGSLPTSNGSQVNFGTSAYPRQGLGNSQPGFAPKPLNLTPGMGPKPSGQSNFMNTGSSMFGQNPGYPQQQSGYPQQQSGYPQGRPGDPQGQFNPYYQGGSGQGLRDVQSLGLPAEYRETPPTDLSPLVASSVPRGSRGR